MFEIVDHCDPFPAELTASSGDTLRRRLSASVEIYCAAQKSQENIAPQHTLIGWLNRFAIRVS
jgi:hypothetical protein